ncbi:c-type cytochrome [Flavobacterium tibetense]|uniref:Cytochrome C552 n=1 Tax=Flavobacterium tibetense TaxID=2233533 RepID=A0A365P567_9FLAO|nr:c-type cytochrome [Flavobacterium tibetense]RBA29725.1 cytochrome C552 [Flavobacterium tibetense]
MLRLQNLVFALTFVLFLSCGKEKEQEFFGKQETPETTENPIVTKGKELFEGKGTCVACHKPDVKVIGPSISEISKIYKEKNANMVKFLKGEGEPIVDPSQYEVMKTNFSITKNMSDEELQALEAYFYSFN